MTDNKDFYCSAGLDTEDCGDGRCPKFCKSYHRKHPTPEQFKEEYKFDYPDDGAVWLRILDDPRECYDEWTLMEYSAAKEWELEAEENDYIPVVYIVCACTPWGCPPADWRP